MTIGAMLASSLLATIARPASWLLGLTAFLLRGGLLVVLMPLLVLPSAVGLGDVLTPALTRLALGGTDVRNVLLAGGLVLAVAGLANVVAAAAERAAIRELATELATDDTRGLRWSAPAPVPSSWPELRRIMAIRGLAAVPVLAVLGWAVPVLVQAAYRELTLPSALSAPLAVRVIGAEPVALVAIVVAWLATGSLAGLAVRATVWSGRGSLASIRFALDAWRRRPVESVVALILPLAVQALVLGIGGAALAMSRTGIRTEIAAADGTGSTVLAVLLIVGLWFAVLALASFVAAWRGAVWTVFVGGTIGGSSDDPRRGWQADRGSATLPGRRPGLVEPERGGR